MLQPFSKTVNILIKRKVDSKQIKTTQPRLENTWLTEMLVTPFVFQVNEVPAMTPNYEVAEVVWVPLDFLMQPDKREPMKWEWKGKTLETDSFLYASYRIWGLSLMMIDEMLMLFRDEA